MDRLAKPSSAPHSSRRRATTPARIASESEKRESSPVVPSPAPGSANTALPSIRHLHPHLPPPAQYYSPSDTSGYPPAVPHASFEQPPVASGSGSFNTASVQLPSDLLPIAEVSDSDKEESAPPKKRRKRQALSCTECKRRKIKCDRSQPCGPCTHRNEPQKCQWHQVETNDKYVTRAEYDQLKSRVDQLESIIARLTNSGNMPTVHPAMGPTPSLTTSGTPIPAYANLSRPPSVPPGMYRPGSERGSDPYNTRRLVSMPSTSRASLAGLTSPPLDREPFSRMMMHPPAATPHTTRQLPPSLAAITTPFEDDGSKKPSAQMLTWQGGRLRQICRATYDQALIPSNHNNRHLLPTSIVLQSLQLCLVTLLLLLSAVVHSAIPLHRSSYPNAVVNLIVKRTHLLFGSVTMGWTIPLVRIGLPGRVHDLVSW